MRHVFKFPDIGEGLEEGTIVEWYVEKGQQVESGQSLVQVETDKVTTDIPSPKTGTIAALYGNEGETINVGDPLAEIEIEGVEGEEAVEEEKKQPEGPSEVGVEEEEADTCLLVRKEWNRPKEEKKMRSQRKKRLQLL